MSMAETNVKEAAERETQVQQRLNVLRTLAEETRFGVASLKNRLDNCLPPQPPEAKNEKSTSETGLCQMATFLQEVIFEFSDIKADIAELTSGLEN